MNCPDQKDPISKTGRKAILYGGEIHFNKRRTHGIKKKNQPVKSLG